ncbi:MAG: hypothetical protein RQ826_15110, partial [Xanthomonadales bacterium]|nr:hypothetical protein [Xanthomonadales bacterium]
MTALIAGEPPRVSALYLAPVILAGVVVAVCASLLLWLPQAFGAEPSVAGSLPPEAFKWGFASAAA